MKQLNESSLNQTTHDLIVDMICWATIQEAIRFGPSISRFQQILKTLHLLTVLFGVQERFPRNNHRWHVQSLSLSVLPWRWI